MLAKEDCLESFEGKEDLQDFDEAEEALSLCDLPIYSDAAEWGDFSKEEQSLSGDQDFFEFFSEDFTSSTCPAAQENIIFCGKLIPYKEPVSDDTQKLEINTTKQNPKKRGLFKWGSRSFNMSRGSKPDMAKGQCMKNNEKNSSKPQRVSSLKSSTMLTSEKHRYNTGKSFDNKYDIYNVQKVSILTSASKSRWPLLMFGLAKFPIEMDISDIKNRQHRRTPSTMFRSFDSGEEVKVGRRKGKGLWTLLKALGCRSFHASAVAKASFGCISRV